MCFGQNHIIRRVLVGLMLLVLTTFSHVESNAESSASRSDIDPRLIEIIEQVKDRTAMSQTGVLRAVPSDEQDETTQDYLNALDALRTAFYTGNEGVILDSVEVFTAIEKTSDVFSSDRIAQLYTLYAELLRNGATSEVIQKALIPFSQDGTWFEKYTALSLSAYVHANSQERQAALQKAQLALAIIPQSSAETAYINYAKAGSTSTISHLHNLQGNTDLALLTSLEYLRLTKDAIDSAADVDLLNNLLYSYSVARDRVSQIYIVEELLEIEKTQQSSVPGLSEMRIALAKNDAGEYESALNYTRLGLEKAELDVIIRQNYVIQATALAGLGRISEARRAAEKGDVNLNRDHMLSVETRRGDLFLAFMLARASDKNYATALYNRQIDVISRKFLDNNSRDTTAMLADLENSRERQAEREVANARAARLQAMSLDRQRKLNRALIGLSLLLGLATLFAVLFARYREKMMRELEAKTLEAASAEKLKTEFLGMISHELRTPLNAIIGISDYLTQYHNDPDIREKASIILKGGNDLFSVVESLTDMARIDADQMELDSVNSDLAAMLHDVPAKWEEPASAKGLIFTHFIDPSLSEHHVDAKRVVQCIDVLMSNAVAFTSSGRVHLHITANRNADQDVTGLTAVVADTGRGMSELVQSRLFKPFMQADTSRKRNHMGTGLNLAIAYALAELMQGDLTVVSRESRGSEFKLTVAMGPVQTPATAELPQTVSPLKVDQLDQPLLDAPITKPIILDTPILDTDAAPSSPIIDLMKPRLDIPALHEVPRLDLPTPKNGSFRILVVDDMEANRDILSLMLETQGHLCEEVPGGFEALALLESAPFDLIILDVHMTPLDGVETLERIRSSNTKYKNIPVIALTADNAPTTNAACMEAGADLFLTKPVRQTELLHALTYLRQTAGSRILSQTA